MSSLTRKQLVDWGRDVERERDALKARVAELESRRSMGTEKFAALLQAEAVILSGMMANPNSLGDAALQDLAARLARNAFDRAATDLNLEALRDE